VDESLTSTIAATGPSDRAGKRQLEMAH